jgi:hypothetical protein
MQIPGLNLLNKTSPTTAPNGLSRQETETESLIVPTREEVLEDSKTSSENHDASGLDERHDDENSEEHLNESSMEKATIEEPAEIFPDPLDMALEADSDHSSAESEADEEQESDDAARYNTFV